MRLLSTIFVFSMLNACDASLLETKPVNHDEISEIDVVEPAQPIDSPAEPFPLCNTQADCLPIELCVMVSVRKAECRPSELVPGAPTFDASNSFGGRIQPPVGMLQGQAIRKPDYNQ